MGKLSWPWTTISGGLRSVFSTLLQPSGPWGRAVSNAVNTLSAKVFSKGVAWRLSPSAKAAEIHKTTNHPVQKAFLIILPLLPFISKFHSFQSGQGFPGIKKYTDPYTPKSDQVVAGEGLLIDKNAQYKGKGRGQILKDADGGKVQPFCGGGKPEQGQAGHHTGPDHPESQDR